MISIDITELVKELKTYKIEVQKRLEYMVAMVAYDFVLTLGNNTPVGDQESIDRIGSRYRKYYSNREKYFGIEMEAGYHSGSWQFSSDGNLQFSTMISTPEGAANDALYEAQANYRLGDTFYIGANTPGMEALENNRSSQTNGAGIVNPSVDTVMGIYRIKASDYYNRL